MHRKSSDGFIQKKLIKKSTKLIKKKVHFHKSSIPSMQPLNCEEAIEAFGEKLFLSVEFLNYY